MMKKKLFLGVDVGSVSTNLAVLDEASNIVESVYLRTQGRPIETVQRGLSEVGKLLGSRAADIAGVGATGSARQLTAVLVGADSVKNEITAHAVAASLVIPDVRTVLEIGGQDSKIIILRNGIVVDFAMNTVCAAGTGSFLDQQAGRLSIPIEEFGDYVLRGMSAVRIAGRCTVFAESDMIHKQQMGHTTEDIIAGLADALVRNYLNNIARGKKIKSPVVFQGGVAANKGIRKAFERELGLEIIVPEHYGVMGAIGAA
ncbi:acyl-CoA dehydratase activase, partial [bacterium]|nr:acyl-CoA dehydratase activase [bacterium]